MHVHASYSINLAEMGSNRDEVHELAARRATEVRRRLAALASAATLEDDEVAFVKAVSVAPSDPGPDAYSPAEEEQIAVEIPELETSAEGELGSHFSAVA